MLKVDSIEFILNDTTSYKINGYQIESFPLIGGTKANLITTKVFNQHGNTFMDAYMDAQDEELVFVIPTFNKTRYEVEDERKMLAAICNPINGTLLMKVTLNTGSVYYRSMVFIYAPSFLVGAENRNPKWQKVQLQYEANNPFWYSEEEIVESFQSVTPEFIFPFTMAAVDPVYFGDIQPNNIAINTGHVEAPVTIRILGTCTNPRIDNLTTGEYLKFNNLTMGANDVLEINTAFGEKSVKLNGGTNVFNLLDYTSTFFNLRVGENEIKFSDNTESPTASIYFYYKNLFITI